MFTGVKQAIASYKHAHYGFYGHKYRHTSFMLMMKILLVLAITMISAIAIAVGMDPIMDLHKYVIPLLCVCVFLLLCMMIIFNTRVLETLIYLYKEKIKGR